MVGIDKRETFWRMVWSCIVLFFINSDIIRVTAVENDGEQVCENDECRNSRPTSDGKSHAGEWAPFRVSTKDKWIAFERLADKYSKWHEKALQNDKLPCQSKKVVVFSPNAGLGDSLGALTSGYLYALRAGRLFFINWKPYPWTVMFKPLPFRYNYREVVKMKTKSGEPLICPNKNDKASYLNGHITTNHPLITEAGEWDFDTTHQDISSYFLQPSAEVQAIMQDIAAGPFGGSNLVKDQTLHKVAVVLRTGNGEYNQFLSPGDEKNFVACFNSYAAKYQKDSKKKVKFSVFVTSDDTGTKSNAIKALKENPHKLDVDVVTLEDSAIHVMHLSKKQSTEAKVREKVRKTTAEFFLIGMCDAKFLTHGSLFGRAASERGGGPEHMNFFISDSRCDGKRNKYSYLQCHEPKYPKICNLS